MAAKSGKCHTVGREVLLLLSSISTCVSEPMSCVSSIIVLPWFLSDPLLLIHIWVISSRKYNLTLTKSTTNSTNFNSYLWGHFSWKMINLFVFAMTCFSAQFRPVACQKARKKYSAGMMTVQNNLFIRVVETAHATIHIKIWCSSSSPNFLP